MPTPIRPRAAHAARPLSPPGDLTDDDSPFAGWQPEALEAYRRFLAAAAASRAVAEAQRPVPTVPSP